jgi:hypothetical protein
MKITPYNKDAAIEMLRARAFLLLMSDEVRSLKGENAAALFDIVGDMSEVAAREAIANFEETQP